MTDLTELIERVRNASGPDRSIDGDIFFRTDPEFPTGVVMHMSAAADPATFATGAYTSVKAPPYTASLDAITALIEKRLPGWHISSTTVGEHNIPQACLTDPDGDCRDFLAHHITEALARVEAFLLAIQENSRDQ